MSVYFERLVGQYAFPRKWSSWRYLFWIWLRRCPVCKNHPRLDRSMQLTHCDPIILECLSCKCATVYPHHDAFYLVGVRETMKAIADVRRKKANPKSSGVCPPENGHD